MRILHLASFHGNIGDVANHESMYVNLQKLFQCALEIDKLEMRLFYRNAQKMYFDEQFAETVNQYDLLILGGGNFFELCWDYSVTGTTVNISEEILRKIKTPIFINGVGIDLAKGYSEANIEKFRAFLNNIFSLNKVFFTVRNDGSRDIIEQYLPEFSSRILTIPDSGFFINDNAIISEYKRIENKKYIGFNIAIDMQEIRYSKRSYEEFLSDLSHTINKLLDEHEDLYIYLFPHIQSDYLAIVDLLKYVNNYYTRTRISIAPLIVDRELETFKLYKECELVVGMRNHATICAIGLGIPSFGMISYRKPELIYNDLNLNHRYLTIDDHNFKEGLYSEIKRVLTDDAYKQLIMGEYSVKLRELNDIRKEFNRKFLEWYQSDYVTSLYSLTKTH